jgi:hypothetical protein
MTTKTVHAYRRTAPISVDLFGVNVKFALNEQGQALAEVEEGPGLDRLLEIPEAYRLLGDAPAPVLPADDEDDPDAASPYLITDGDDTIDLRTLDEAALRAFAVENEIDIPGTVKRVETIRDRIVAALNSIN